MNRSPEHCADGPGYVEDVLPLALAWLAQGRRVALATVIQTWGSSPRRAGSQLVVDDAGEFQGSVSGGCVEGAVISAAMKAMETGNGEVLDFAVSDDRAWDVGLACGGRVRILVEPFEDDGPGDSTGIPARHPA